MTERKEIGKIQKATFGMGGYQDAMIGISFSLGSNGWGVGDFWGAWAVERSEHCKWSEQDRIDEMGKTVWRIRNLLKDANVDDIARLVGKPIEVTFDGNSLKSWRILTEAI